VCCSPDSIFSLHQEKLELLLLKENSESVRNLFLSLTSTSKLNR
jgi:hypothetical protein